jgi:hypothetical protein
MQHRNRFQPTTTAGLPRRLLRALGRFLGVGLLAAFALYQAGNPSLRDRISDSPSAVRRVARARDARAIPRGAVLGLSVLAGSLAAGMYLRRRIITAVTFDDAAAELALDYRYPAGPPRVLRIPYGRLRADLATRKESNGYRMLVLYFFDGQIPAARINSSHHQFEAGDLKEIAARIHQLNPGS